MAQKSIGPQEVVSAYRNLYKAGLRCIRYSRPARYTLRYILRNAFQKEPASSYNKQRVSNTLKFLEDASTYSGIEHRIVKNLLVVRYWRNRDRKPTQFIKTQTQLAADVRSTRWAHWDATLQMLNESEQLCLRS